MAGRTTLDITMRGDRAVQRALAELPREAQREMKDNAEKLSRELANAIRRAGRADSRQAARASRTVRTLRGTTPKVIAGPHPFLFGSEFGVKRRFGWYAKRRYYRSPERQFKPYRGQASYWFFAEYERSGPRVDAAAREIADGIVRAWGRG